MRILEKGCTRVVRCKKCKSLLEFDESDIKYERKLSFTKDIKNISFDDEYIICPVCLNSIYINE